VTHYRSPTRPTAGSDIFWAEMAPCDHLVQLYENEGAFLDSLEAFAAGALLSGESLIVIATPAHRLALNQRLKARSIDVAYIHAGDQYIELDAEATLSQFMVDGWPDDILFEELVRDLLTRARRNGRRVRAFGEMVALMWARGENAATVRLEHLWHSLCKREQFPLLCSYPRSGFTGDAANSIREICETHSRLVA
jgi:hypothetical protein